MIDALNFRQSEGLQNLPESTNCNSAGADISEVIAGAREAEY